MCQKLKKDNARQTGTVDLHPLVVEHYLSALEAKSVPFRWTVTAMS
jgi:hypothetical protein